MAGWFSHKEFFITHISFENASPLGGVGVRGVLVLVQKVARGKVEEEPLANQKLCHTGVPSITLDLRVATSVWRQILP